METINIVLLVTALYAIVATVAVIYWFKCSKLILVEHSKVLNKLVEETRLGHIGEEAFSAVFMTVMEEPEPVKVCHKCGRILPASDFGRERGVCKECRRKL